MEGNLSKPGRQQERHQTKGLTSRTVAVYMPVLNFFVFSLMI